MTLRECPQWVEAGHSRCERKDCPTGTLLCLPDGDQHRKSSLHLLFYPRRPRRACEWSHAKAVTFTVNLAATRSVTLAAREARMSRKSAYALKSRDPAFAAVWTAAMKAAAKAPREGNKVDEVEGPLVSLGQGNASHSRSDRERAFAGLVARLRESPPLADLPLAP
jgi:hypothetical protein